MKNLSEHLQEWVRAGRAEVISSDVARSFTSYLNSLPWNQSGTGINWEMVGGINLNLASVNEAAVSAWLNSTSFWNDPYIVFCFGPDELCVASEALFAIANIDQAFWRAPGTRFIFGATLEDGIIIPKFDHFGEYNGSEKLIGRCRDY